MIRYTKEHLYIDQIFNAGIWIIGITEYALRQIGDIQYFAVLPSTNDRLEKGDVIAEYETLKTCGTILAPCGLYVASSFKRADKDSILKDHRLIGCFYTCPILDELMTKEEYDEYCQLKED